jgi:hypothetical protein
MRSRPARRDAASAANPPLSRTNASARSKSPVHGVHEGAGWNDLLKYFATAQDPTAQPDFVDVAAGSFLDGPSSARLIASITPGTYGLVCLYDMTATTGNAAPGSGPYTVGP